MTRITSSISADEVHRAEQSQDGPQHQHHARRVDKAAVLYRGTLFAYGDETSRVSIQHSLKSKRLLARLARRRTMLRNAMKPAVMGKARARKVDAGRAAPPLARAGVNRRAWRDADHSQSEKDSKHGREQHEDGDGGKQGSRQPSDGNQGGNNQGSGGGSGQQGNMHQDTHRTSQTVHDRSGKTAAVASRLQQIAGQVTEPGHEDAHLSAVRAAFTDDLVDIVERLLADPNAQIDQLVMTQSINLLSIQQRIGRLPPVGLGAFVERAKERLAMRGQDRKHSLPAAADTLSRSSSILPLIPLLALNADRPSTSLQRGRALATLRSLRAARDSLSSSHKGSNTSDLSWAKSPGENL